MEERYKRNIPAITEEEQAVLSTKTVAVTGCGGLGGHIIESLARIGIGRLLLIDCDEFSETNLNRQLFSKESNLGKRKVEEAKFRVHEINSNIDVEIIDQKIDSSNAEDILKNADIVIDALDNVDGRFAVCDACEKLGLYFIHGAIGGWRAQVSTIAPGSKGLDKIYPRDMASNPPAVLSFTPFLCASIQVSEAVKVLLGQDDTLEGKMLVADLQSNMFIIIDLI